MSRHPTSERLTTALGTTALGTTALGTTALGTTALGPHSGRVASSWAVDPPTVPLRLRLPGAEPTPERDVQSAAEYTRSGWVVGALRSSVPAAWRGARVDPGRPGATALALVAALAAVVAAVGVWMERPRVEPVGALPAVVVTSETPPTPSTEAISAAPVGPLVVSVSGKVARPGLVEVPDGARVADVLDMAGGALPGTDLSGLNLARRVVDGEQIAVAVPPAPDAAPTPDAPGGAAEGGAGDGGKVDLNTATEAQLDELPGVGPVTAQSILEWRESNGPFSGVEQLREVDGIGERRFAQLRELVVV